MAPAATSWTSRCSFEDGFTASPLAWTGAGAVVLRRGPANEQGTRLVVDARDGDGGLTEFLVDTGTSCAFLSDGAPAARTARDTSRRMRLLANDGASAYMGRDATIPALDLGGLAGVGVPVFVLERPHDLHHPANILGMAWMSGLTLSHDHRTDGWRLGPTGGAAATGGGETLLEAPGLPVVPLVDEAGRTVYGLIDTGTPLSLVEPGQAGGRFRVKDAAGGTLLEIEARTEAPWRGLSPGGRPVTVWIGLDALSGRSWTIDFATRRWSFGP